MQVGENIYRLRSENSMSQGELSEILNVSRQSISKWENGMAMPELDKLIKLSRLFGVTLDQLVSDEETPKPCGQTRGKPGTGLILRWVAAGLIMIPSAVMLLVSLSKNGLFSLGGTEIICGAAMLTGVLLASDFDPKVLLMTTLIYMGAFMTGMRLPQMNGPVYDLLVWVMGLVIFGGVMIWCSRMARREELQSSR